MSAICAFNYTNPWFTYVKSLLSDKNINRQIKDPLIFIITSIRFIQFHSRLIYISVWEFEYKTQWTMRIYMYDHIYTYTWYVIVISLNIYIYIHTRLKRTHKKNTRWWGGGGIVFFFSTALYILASASIKRRLQCILKTHVYSMHWDLKMISFNMVLGYQAIFEKPNYLKL